MLRTTLLFCFLLTACEGRVSDLGDVGDTVVTIRDRSGPQLDFSCDAATVETRAPLHCTASATHPTGEALSCTLTFDDGRSSIELGDCSLAAITREVRSSSPGMLTVTVIARDTSDRVATHSVQVSITGLPNQPPTVTAFTANPLTGKAPLTTTLAFRVADPEGDALTCTLDGAPIDCTAGMTTLTFRTPGATKVKLTVTDSGGLSANQELTLDVTPPTVDLNIARIEFGQTVVKEQLALVATKPALLRVTVLANEPNVSATVDVEATQGSTLLGKQRLTGPAQIPQMETPGDLSKSFRFVMPAAWVTPGVSLRVRVDADDALLEADETNNDVTSLPTVTPARQVHLTSVPVMGPDGAVGQPLDLDDTIAAVWPVTGVEAKTRAPFTWTQEISPSDANSWAALLGGLAQAKGSDGSDRNYYGWVRANFGGGVAGIGYLGQATATGRDDSAQVAAHELGHNFGRNHAPCGGAAGADPSYPYPNARIGTYGWNGSQLLAPTQFVDLMSYCNPGWVSDYSYEGVQRFMEGRNEFDPGAVLPFIAADDVVMFAGRVSPDGVVTLSDPQRFHGRVSARLDSSSTVVVQKLIDGRVVRVPVTLVETSEGEEKQFVVVTPYVGELASWAVELNAVVIAQRESDTRPFTPVVKLARDGEAVRVTWTGAHSLLVAHVAANGERTTLTVDARGGSVVVLPPPGGRFEVSASDGVRSVAKQFENR
ncbi:MAG: M66 family metalloprotease [Archangium sp.]